MSDSLDFLQKLKPLNTVNKPSTSFFFELTKSHNNVYVHTIDAHNFRPLNIDPDTVDGNEGHALNIMFSKVGFSYESGEEFCVTTDSMAAAKLAECSNVVLEGKSVPLKPIETGIGSIILQIEPKFEDPSILVPKFRLKAHDGDYTYNFFLLSETIACDTERFMFVKSLGDNFAQLSIFEHEFPAKSLEKYLEIFLTYVRNVKIEIPEVKLSFGEEIKCEPTIVIEKVDVDKALYVSACLTPPGENLSAVEGLKTTYIVKRTDSNQLTAYPLDYSNSEKLCEQLYHQIERYAPNRTEAKQIYFDGSIIIVPEQTASNFLLQGLPALLKDYKIAGLEQIKDYKLRPVTPRLNLRLKSGINFLEGTAEVDIEGQMFTIRDILSQYKANKYVTLADGARGVLDDKFVRRIERIFGSKSAGGNNFKVSIFDLPEIENYIEDSIKNAEILKRPREFYQGFNNLSKKKLRLPGIQASLRKYQTDGVKWLDYLYENNVGGCLADDMGLGKTLQLICLIERHLKDSEKPFLVVMPRSLIFNWENELKKFAPHIDAFVYYGTNRDSTEALKHRVILTTYAVVRNDIKTLKEVDFEAIILDESQIIKNLESQQTKAVSLLKSKHRFALSGTPIENNLSELYSLFRFINPGMFGSLQDFQQRYLNPIQNDHDEEAMHSLRRKVFPFMLRRLKKDVLKDLPDRIDNTIYVDMDSEQAHYYEQRRKFYNELMAETIATEGLTKAQFAMLQAINELRRIASVPESLTDGQITSPKINLLVEQIAMAVENGHKVVVFFNFVAGLEILAERLNSIGINTETMTGATRNRKEIVNNFQESEDCKVLVMTLKTGGVGLNLTAADIVFIVEPWWNVAAQEQAINRLYRIGQKSTVLSYSMITKDTIEEKIEQLQKMKADLFDNVISSDDTTSKKLTEEDINFILS